MSPAVARRGELEIAYRTLGDASSAVVLLMGLGGRSADWGPWFPAALAREHRVVLVDNRGTGQSSKPEGPYPLEELALDVLAVLEELGLEQVTLCGLSMGGLIAQQLALSHPARVSALVLLSTFSGGLIVPRAPEVLRAFFPARGTAPDVVTRQALGLITGRGFAAAHPERIEQLVRLAVEQPTPKHAFSAQLQGILGTALASELPRVRCRTLVIHGDDDALIPREHGERLAELIPGASWRLLPGVGHLAPWEAPERLSELVLDFLR